MHNFLLMITLFALSGCEYKCIKPENLSVGVYEKLDIVSTEQKWVSSYVHISDILKVVEINIVPDKINFCFKHYEDFIIQPGNNYITLSQFALKKGDKLSFSIIGNKICKNNNDIVYKKIDENCYDVEEEYFSYILNQNECRQVWQNKEYKHTLCPNKYILGEVNWLNGKEYWSSDFSKLNKENKNIQNIFKSIKQQVKNMDCSNLSYIQKNEIDTYFLNLACKNMCYSSSQNCVQTESNTMMDDILIANLERSLTISNEKITEIIKKILKKEIKTFIPSLIVSMQKESFEHIKNDGIRTNSNYIMQGNHDKNTELKFELRNDGIGGYNVRITRIPDTTENNLYIYVSNRFPEHNPGENQEDIPVNISKVHEVEYMENLKEKLKDKKGIIYYGIKDHGCNYNNQGQFSINLTIKEQHKKTFSKIYSYFDNKIKNAFFGSNYKNQSVIYSEFSPIKSFYQSFIESSRTKTIRSTIVSLLLLYIILYTLYYFFGLTHISIYEFLIISIKIGIISQLLRDNSWDFFYKNAFSVFINTPKKLLEITNFRGTSSNIFEFLELPLNRFLSLHSILLIISFIFSGPIGVISFCLIIWGLVVVVLSSFNALFFFITSIGILALLLSLAPIFIIFLLFKYTRQLFSNWIRNLARFSIHPVVLLIFISLISQAMDYIMYSIFDFEVCATCILKINLKVFEFCILYGYVSKYTPNIITIITFVILGHTMKALIEASSKISDSLFYNYIHEEPGKEYQQNLMGLVGLDEQSIYRRQIKEGYLFQDIQKKIGSSANQLPRMLEKQSYYDKE